MGAVSIIPQREHIRSMTCGGVRTNKLAITEAKHWFEPKKNTPSSSTFLTNATHHHASSSALARRKDSVRLEVAAC